MAGFRLTPIDEAAVERSARILGPFSAGAKALAEFYERKNAGQDVRLFVCGNTFVVGPPISTPTQQEKPHEG